MITPLNNRAIVDIPVISDPSAKLIIPEDVRKSMNPIQKSKVLAISPDGDLKEYLEVGDEIVYDLFQMEIVIVDDQPYGLVDKGVIKCIVKKELTQGEK